MPKPDLLAAQFDAQWSTSTSQPDVDAFLQSHPEASLDVQIEVILVDQLRNYQAGHPKSVEDYLNRYPGVAGNEAYAVALIVAEYRHRLAADHTLDAAEVRSRFPAVADLVLEWLTNDRVASVDVDSSNDEQASLNTIDHDREDFSSQLETPSGVSGRRPTVTTDGIASVPDVTVDMDGVSVSFGMSTGEIGDVPSRIGRYEILRLVGEGGFGGVFLARDDDLDRMVAIKIARRDRVATPEDVQQYLSEARIVANLDHPNIVPVHDVGETDDGRCFVVSKYVEGHDLVDYIKEVRPTRAQIIDILIDVARALDYAHDKGVIHRDVKPSNILVDGRDTAYVIDYGVAIKQEHYGTGAKIVGTPAYRSPEQARGEGHLVDRRSDVFCLGVVLYEGLCGKRPFRAGSMHKVLEKVCNDEPVSLPQRDSSIPCELDRICSKAMSKRAADRYETAADMADDLPLFRNENDAATDSVSRVQSLEGSVLTGSSKLTRSTKSSSVSVAVQVVPKGLQSFGAEDADFFLALLPGTKDRDGLPASVRFWTNRIEGRQSEELFRVGLI